MDFTLRHLAVKDLKPRQRPIDADARHLSMMDAIAPYAKTVVQKNLTPVYVDYKKRNSKLVLVLCPEWSPFMPPFSLARLSGVAKHAGYETHIMDLNVKAYRAHEDDWIPNRKIPFRLWDPSASWHWLGDTYIKDIHPVLEPILNCALDEIIEINPNVVGFSMYYISEEPTKWMAQELKRRAPHIKIAIGGPNAHKSWFKIQSYYDYVVVGEGEANLLKLLDDVEQGIEYETTQVLSQPEDERINISGLPMPDYESIDFSLYDLPNGVNTEISRGCTAKCTFCEETHFWRYRQRQAVDLITEIEWLYYNKGTDVIWFIDSLVNGNLKELRAFCKAVEAKGLKINWTGYARCDGRMDLEYFKDLKAGGCVMLNYGIESGSQKVLDHMDKGVTIAEMEQNFIDGKKVGIWAATNWIVGFPTEDFQDFADSMTFLWRNRNMNINNVGAGVGFAQGPETITGQNPHRFNLSYQKYQGHWITNDFTKGGTHVMMRVKLFHIFLDMMKKTTDVPFTYPIRESLKMFHYKIKLDDPTIQREIEYEKFDYEIIKVKINPFADTLVNEIWPFFRMLWRTRGGYRAVIDFNPEIDIKEFGEQFGPGMLTAKFIFVINHEGEWQANFNIVFDQVDNPLDDREPRPNGRKGPFYAQDYSRMMSNTAKRARRLAKPYWDIETGRTDRDFWDMLSEEHILNTTVDFGFQHTFKQEGKWEHWNKYSVSIADKSNSSEHHSATVSTEIPITIIGRKRNKHVRS